MYGQDVISVPCDKCSGGYIGVDLCPFCDGHERVLIAEQRKMNLPAMFAVAGVLIGVLVLSFFASIGIIRLIDWVGRIR